jgi:hypothetical protein
MNIRRVSLDDVLVEDDGAIVLVGSRLSRVSMLALSILARVDEWRSLAELMSHVIAEFGDPPGGDPIGQLVAIVITLETAGLVDVDRKPA